MPAEAQPADLAAYLQSTEAAAEVKRRLAGGVYRRGCWSVFCPNELGMVHGLSYCYDEFRCEPIRVYFRKEGPRYLVTDLGEALRAHALRTGEVDVHPPAQMLSSGVMERDGRLMACYLRGDSLCLGIEPAELPAAIVRVLAAAHRAAPKEKCDAG